MYFDNTGIVFPTLFTLVMHTDYKMDALKTSKLITRKAGNV